ncbi:hypothetical protein [Streptomyces sp. NPDC051636]|uniref:hypothetical protein n=1 Tax=Streptomyces sp. NPDC051636 TaxID=3365663 RepID=UPI0037908858
MPPRAALVDRHGPRRALIPMVSLYGALLCALAALTWRPGARPALLGTAAALAGACAPPLGPTTRTVWAGLLDGPRLLARAYSLDGVAEELLYVSGPMLVGVLVPFTSPAAGVLLSALLIVAGTCAFVSSRAMPGPRPTPGPGKPGALSRAPAGCSPRWSWPRAWASRSAAWNCW